MWTFTSHQFNIHKHIVLDGAPFLLSPMHIAIETLQMRIARICVALFHYATVPHVHLECFHFQFPYVLRLRQHETQHPIRYTGIVPKVKRVFLYQVVDNSSKIFAYVALRKEPVNNPICFFQRMGHQQALQSDLYIFHCQQLIIHSQRIHQPVNEMRVFVNRVKEHKQHLTLTSPIFDMCYRFLDVQEQLIPIRHILRIDLITEPIQYVLHKAPIPDLFRNCHVPFPCHIKDSLPRIVRAFFKPIQQLQHNVGQRVHHLLVIGKAHFLRHPANNLLVSVH